MDVELIDFTGAPDLWAGPELMIFTKSTRLEMNPGLLGEIKAWSPDKKVEELEYMANTIPSSWEFMHFTFLITGVTRAFTHQLVRTRTASFAQQTMRVLDVSDAEVKNTVSLAKHPTEHWNYNNHASNAMENYSELIEAGVPVEDARGLLPTNICTNIAMNINLRNLSTMVKSRTSPRTQGEYREFLELMRAEVLDRWPFFKNFLEPRGNDAITMIEQVVSAQPNMVKGDKVDVYKALDLLRKEL